MTELLAPEQALARVPGLRGQVACREIGGGLTNRSFLVRSGSAQFVLRLDAEHTAALGLDRRTELRVLINAAQASLAPEVRYADPEAGILLYEFLPGPVWDRASLDDSDKLGRLAVLLRQVHELPDAGVVLDALAAALRYEAIAAQRAEWRADAARCVEIVRATPESPARCCCHNDPVAPNIVGNATGYAQLKLLDWEYACDNDPYFDLASVIAYHDLAGKQSDRLLQCYTGALTAEARERLQLQLRLYDALQTLWLAARCVIAPDSEHLARLAQLRGRIR